MELTEAESKLIEASRVGRPADYQSGNPDQDDPAKGGAWGEERTIRAEVVDALVTGRNPEWSIHPKGIWVLGAKITGLLDFEGAEAKCALGLCFCHILDGISLRYARMQSVVLGGSEIGELVADGVRISGGLILKSTRVSRGIRIPLADVSGNIECDGAKFLPDTQGVALHAEQVRVVGSVMLRNNFASFGRVTLSGARIDGQLSCDHATFSNSSGVAFLADAAKIGMNLSFTESSCCGGASLIQAEIAGPLFCDGSRFVAGQSGEAFVADGISVGGSVCLRRNFIAQGFGARGVVRLPRAKIADSLDCDQGSFINAATRLPGEGSAGEALALVADGVKIGSAMRLRGATCQGTLRLVNAQISGDLDFQSIQFREPAEVIAEHVVVGGRLWWRDVKTAANMLVSLYTAHARVLIDDPESWPKSGNLLLEGLTYDWAFLSDANGNLGPVNAESRLRWLSLARFAMQPYEQLITVLRATGDEGGARTVYIEGQRALRKSGNLGKAAQAANWFLDWSIRYGYRTWRAALLLAMPVVLLGAFLFCIWFWNMQTSVVEVPAATTAHAAAIQVAPERSAANPNSPRNSWPSSLDHLLFSLSYSVAVFLPFGDSYAKSSYPLRPRRPEDWWFYLFESWYIFETISGWVVAGLITAGLSGLTRR